MDNPQFDIIISNPPYISREAFRKETTRSVRNWEPKLALVPRKLPKEKRSKDIDPTDIFYHRLLVLHSDIFKSQVLLMEVGDEVQAIRVAKMAMGHCGASNHIEIWKDNPNVDILENIHTGGSRIPVRGSGSFRAVTLFRFSRHQESSQFKES
jgi:methylase of polypeptide subunit release factors